MINFKMPERFPPTIIAVIFLSIGFGLGYLYCDNKSGKTEADALWADAQKSLKQREEELKALGLLKQKQESNYELFKNVDCLNRPVYDSLLLWEANAENRSQSGTPNETLAPPKSTDTYTDRLRERLRKLFE